MAAIDRHEMALLIMEGAIGLRRPPGTDPAAALAEAARSEPETVAGFYRAADKIADYLVRQINEAGHA